MPQRIVTTAANGGAGSLRQAIAQAKSGDTIVFASSLSGKTITLASQLQISAGKRLTIDGSGAPGLTLSGDNEHRILQVNSNQNLTANLTLKNLTLANGNTPGRGGAVHVAHRGKLTVQNVRFHNNVADEGGGAIFTAFEGQLTVVSSTFTANRAVAGNNERGAGAIAFWGPDALVVRNSRFIGNQGINGGAINSLNGKLTIANSLFRNNKTTAAQYDTGNPRPFLRGYGGAIYTDRASTGSNATSGTISIRNSTFDGNQGRGEGGAAYLYTGTQDRVVIANSRFENNKVFQLPNGGNGGNGGAVVQMNNGLNKGFTVSNTLFANNTATGQGGGIWTMDAPTTIVNSTFSRNRTLGQTGSSIGGGLALYSPTAIRRSTFVNNRAGWVGGAIAASTSDKVSIKATIFANNTADNGPNDWGIQQHTNRELVDLGNNFQYPPKQTNSFNDYNATATIRTDLNPQLSLQPNGTYAVGNPAVTAGANPSGQIGNGQLKQNGIDIAAGAALVQGDDSGSLAPVNDTSVGPEQTAVKQDPGILDPNGGNNAIDSHMDDDLLNGGAKFSQISSGVGNNQILDYGAAYTSIDDFQVGMDGIELVDVNYDDFSFVQGSGIGAGNDGVVVLENRKPVSIEPHLLSKSALGGPMSCDARLWDDS